MDIPQKMHNAILAVGSEVWKELRNNCNERDVVGELAKTTLEFAGKTYTLEIDCYWDRSNYFDYHIKGHGIDCRKLVACMM